MCEGESCARACVHAPGAGALPLPAPRPLLACSLPSFPRPALQPSPRNQCSCYRAGCGFLQSLPRPPLHPERARSPAQERPPVPSCEPRPQPQTAPRSRLPAHPPGRRGAGGGRDPDAPTPNPREVGEGPEAGTCQLTGAASQAGSWAAGRREEGRGPSPADAAARLPTERRGGGEAADPGRGRHQEPGSPGLISARVLRGRDGRPRSEAAADPRCASRPPSPIPGAVAPISPPYLRRRVPPSGRCGPWRGGGCTVGSSEGIFSGALLLVRLVGEPGRH